MSSREQELLANRIRHKIATLVVPLAEIEQRTGVHMLPAQWEAVFRKAGFWVGESINIQEMRDKGQLKWWKNGPVIGRVVASHDVPNTKDLPRVDNLISVNIAYASPHAPFVGVLTSTPSLKYFHHLPSWRVPRLHVPYSPVGSKYIYHETRKVNRMKVKPIRERPSVGMVCSDREAGVGDFQDDIFFLPQESQVGISIRAYLGDYALRVHFRLRRRRVLSLVYICKRLQAVLGAR